VWQASKTGDAVVVHYYSHSPALGVFLRGWCKLLGVVFTVDLCEWKPAIPRARWADKWYYKAFRLSQADGVIVISKFLAQQCRLLAPRTPVLKVPILFDPAEFGPACPRPPSAAKDPYVLWCGQLSGYIDSVLWLARAVAGAHGRGSKVRFLVVGECSSEAAAKLRATAVSAGLPKDSLVLTGYLERRELLRLLAGASALLAPLQSGLRSEARFPIKLAEYLATGRLVVTNAVGEVTSYLEHRHSALVVPPDNLKLFSESIAWAVENKEAARQIGLRGREVALQNFDFRLHGPRVAQFFADIMASTRRSEVSA
jgi:glycosyltransferase involved in cell wall biosynthesis